MLLLLGIALVILMVGIAAFLEKPHSPEWVRHAGQRRLEVLPTEPRAQPLKNIHRYRLAARKQSWPQTARVAPARS